MEACPGKDGGGSRWRKGGSAAAAAGRLASPLVTVCGKDLAFVGAGQKAAFSGRWSQHARFGAQVQVDGVNEQMKQRSFRTGPETGSA